MVIFQSFYMKGNYTTKPFSNMAATGCLVGRLALVTGKPLFCDLHLQLLICNGFPLHRCQNAIRKEF